MVRAKEPVQVEEPPEFIHLLQEEKKRRLILHFEVTQVLVMNDAENALTTDQVLNEQLAEMAWGVLDTETGEWVLESEQPTLDPPDRSMTSYTQHCAEKFPASEGVDGTTQQENLALQAKAKHHFTAKGEPGQKFRGVYDQLVKALAVPNGVKKGFGIDKVRLDETELPPDPTQDESANLVRFGRYRILPSFFKLLQELNREKRADVTIVLRSSSAELLDEIANELNMFCNCKHPCYSGQNRTKKAIFNGDKNTKDFQLREAAKGKIDREEKTLYLTFEHRDSNPPPPPLPKEGEPGYDPDMPPPPAPPPMPTIYEGHPQMVAGLVKEVCAEMAMAYIHTVRPRGEDGEMQQVDHLLLLDEADTGVHQVYFYPGTRKPQVEVWDAGTRTDVESLPDCFVRVDPYRAITDVEYFVKNVAGCEQLRTAKIVAGKKAPSPDGSADLSQEELKGLPAKEYLYATVIPALMPALEVVSRDRPEDPLTWLALYMLRHPKMYSKTLEGKPVAPEA